MKKSYFILSLALVLFSGLLSAQQKLGHVNSQELMQLMPERIEAEQKLQALNAQLEERMTILQADYQGKITAFQALAEDTPTSTVNDMRDEIIGMETRIQEFRANAERDLVTKQEELLTPMLEKLQDAIDQVGKENGFTYILDISTGAVVFQAGEDIAPLVKVKLGITG